MRRLKFNKIFLICFLVALFGFVIYHFGIKHFIGAEIQAVEYGKSRDIIETDSVFVRDEIVLKNDSYNSNNLKYLLSDGERISKNGVIAEVYSSAENAKKSYKIDDLDKEIEVLEKLNLTKYNIFKGINFINTQINEEIKNWLLAFGDVKFLEARECRQKILYLLSERQVVLGKNIDLDEKIKQLRAEKSDLLSSFSSKLSVVKSPESGDFINDIDGYEDLFDYKNILNSDLNNLDFEKIVNRSYKNSDTRVVGKIIKSEDWYMICNIPEEKADKLSVGEEVKVSMPSSESFSEIPCIVSAINKKSNSNEFILIISCNYMDKNLACVRNENISIILNEYSGLKVKRSAIHKYTNTEKEGELGVYVKVGGYLKLKKVKPLFWSDSEVVCAYDSEEILDDSYLQIGDNVVDKGINLFDGKRL